MSRIVTLVLFLVLVVGGGVLIGTATVPGEWYEALAKPAFNPPNWIFAPVWTILYVMIAVAGWRVWTRTHTAGAMAIWWLQLGLNFLWSPVFFTQKCDRSGLCYHPRIAGEHPRLYLGYKTAGPGGCIDVCSLRGMGRICCTTQRLDSGSQLTSAALHKLHVACTMPLCDKRSRRS